MSSIQVILVITAHVLLCARQYEAHVQYPIMAVCYVSPNSGNASHMIKGTIIFEQLQADANTTVTVKLEGFKTDDEEKLHGFHIHEHGQLSRQCKSAGGHYNPDNVDHGAPSDSIRHVGDLGNVEEMDNMGKIDTEFEDHVIQLSGDQSIIGKSIVIHETEDDLGKTDAPDSKKTGSAGSRLACCVIEEYDPTVHNTGNQLSFQLSTVVTFTLSTLYVYKLSLIQ